MSERPIYITEFDLERLIALIGEARRGDYKHSAYLEELEKELKRGARVAPKDVPPDVITMNSTARLLDVDSGEEMTLTLVFPEDADIVQDKISVLAPIGTAMLGYRVGDIFEWKVPDGTRRLRVEEIVYQPEAKGDYHL